MSTATTEEPTEQQNEHAAFLARTMDDLGLLLKDGEIQPATPEAAEATPAADAPYPLTTLGDAAGRQKEEAEFAVAHPEQKKAEPKAEKKKETPEVETSAEEPKPIVVKKPSVESLVQETVNRAMAEKKPTAAPTEAKLPAPPPAPNADADYEASLGEDERADIEFARVAEAKMPEKYKDLAKKQVGFYRKLDGYVENAKKENPNRTFDESDPEFMDFIRENKPRVNPHDQLKVVRMQATEEATKSADEKFNKFSEEAKAQRRLEESRPKIEKAASETASALESAFVDPRKPEEITANTADPRTEEEQIAAATIARAKESGWDEVVKKDPVHGGIVRSVIDTTARRAAEFAAMVTGVAQFQPNNPDHVWLAKFVDHQTKVLQSLGPKAGQRQMQDGTVLSFMPRDQYIAEIQKDPTTAQKHWTFDDGQIQAMIVQNSKQDIPRLLKYERDRLTAAGYKWEGPTPGKPQLPKPGNPAPPKPASAPPKPSPKAAPSISPGASQNGHVHAPSAFTDREKELLGIPNMV